MDTNQIIAELDTEIARLQHAKALLSGTTTTNITTRKKRGPNKAKLTVLPAIAAKRIMSPEGRARIAAAQKARWAKSKKAAKKAA